MDYNNIAPWELLQKKIIWEQLKHIQNKKILDFGSGRGITANHFATNNEVIAIEPDENMINEGIRGNSYTQIKGDITELENFEDEFFDVIICHNVLEYVEERVEVLKEFSRVLKKDGQLSIVKHNRAGRVMQMVVLLNNFEHANQLLDGKYGQSKEFGPIRYYGDLDILQWSNDFELEMVWGLRTFWDLQQNQEIQKDKSWQEKMLEIELKVSGREEYKAIAFFHHLILRKK